MNVLYYFIISWIFWILYHLELNQLIWGKKQLMWWTSLIILLSFLKIIISLRNFKHIYLQVLNAIKLCAVGETKINKTTALGLQLIA